MAIQLTYGPRQRFRAHCADLNVIGRTDASLPVAVAEYRLNEGEWRSFYVESVPSDGIDWSYQYKPSPAGLRLPEAGDFNIEIPVASEDLRTGTNELDLRIVDSRGEEDRLACVVEWDREPPLLPLEIDLNSAVTVQDVGQVVNGAFDIDPSACVIRARAPVQPDSLLLLGPPARSQEATYEFRYFDGTRSKYIGLSDFFLGHRATDSSLGIKPLWATTGLATIRPRGEFAWEARIWITGGDLPGWRPDSPLPRPVVVRTDPPAHAPLTPRLWYRVRHQVVLDGAACTARLRIWAAGETEPADWLCAESVTAGWLETAHASFGLFQHSGMPSEWRGLRLVGLPHSSQ